MTNNIKLFSLRLSNVGVNGVLSIEFSFPLSCNRSYSRAMNKFLLYRTLIMRVPITFNLCPPPSPLTETQSVKLLIGDKVAG